MIKNVPLYIPIALIILIAGVLFWFVTQKGNKPGDKVEMLSYESVQHGYSIKYPENLTIAEDGAGNVSLSENGGEGKKIVELRTFTVENNSRESFETAVAKEMGLLCASVTTPEFDCNPDNLELFTTSNGLLGYELDLVNAGAATSSGKTAEKGPFFLLPLFAVNKMLLIQPDMTLSRENTDASTLRNIARSVRPPRIELSTDAVTEHVRTIINDLSNEVGKPPVLGGTFYVTSIEANAGTGTVSYEDGHVAYTANFTYAADDNGRIVLSSFIVQ